MRIPVAAAVCRSAVSVFGLVLVLAAAAALGPVGCGTDSQEGEAGTAQRKAMVPAAAVDSSALTLPDSLLETGTAELPAPAEVVPSATPAAAPAAAAATPPPAGTWSVQAGSFRRLDNAESLAGRIRALGLSPIIETAEPGGVTYYRVVVPGLGDRQAAERVGERLRAELDIRYLIRSSR